MLNPQWADVREYLDRFVEHHRLTASPATIVEFRRMQVELDISDVLPAIRVPTIVLDKWRQETGSAEVAAVIPGAAYVDLPGQGFALWETISRWRRSTTSWRAARPGRCRTPCSRPCSSPISSTRRDVRPSGGQAVGRGLDAPPRGRTQGARAHRGEEVDTAGDGFF
jgi:hypothetical protein